MDTEETIKSYLAKTKPIIDNEIEKIIPRKASPSSLENVFGKPRYTYDEDSLNKAL